MLQDTIRKSLIELLILWERFEDISAAVMFAVISLRLGKKSVQNIKAAGQSWCITSLGLDHLLSLASSFSAYRGWLIRYHHHLLYRPNSLWYLYESSFSLSDGFDDIMGLKAIWNSRLMESQEGVPDNIYMISPHDGSRHRSRVRELRTRSDPCWKRLESLIPIIHIEWLL